MPDIYTYDKDQLEQLRLGKKYGVDTSVYENPAYMALQMEWIRKGLERRIDVSLYADPAYDWFQMEEIYTGIIEGIDVSKYLDPAVPYDRMREIRKGLEVGVDLSSFGAYGAGELRELRHALKHNIHIVKYMVAGYDAEQLGVIRDALSSGIDMDKYLAKEYRGIALNEILLGLKKKLNVETYANVAYSWQQMREIREGMEERLDIDKYSSYLYSAGQMHEIRLGLEAGLDVTSYRSLMYTARDMNRMRRKLIEELTSGSSIPMVPGDDGYNEYLFDTENNGAICLLDDGSVDFKTSFKYPSCKKDDVLAIYHDATDGKNGISSEGHIIRAVRGREKRLLSGRGVYYDEKSRTYKASLEGWIHLDEAGDLLEIRQAETLDCVTYAMGRVVRSGNVEVLGNIEAGATIELDGDLIVDGHVEDATIKCTGNIIIRGGINGNDRAEIYTQKSLVCMYIESCNVKAGGDVYANYILSSEVTAAGMINALGNKGSIISSCVTSESGIICRQAGNEAKAATRLCLCFPKSDEKEEQRLIEDGHKVYEEIKILIQARANFRQRFSAEERNNNAEFIKLEKAIYTKNLELREIESKTSAIKEKIKNRANTKITILEKLHGDAQVMFGRARFSPENEMDGKMDFVLVNGKINIIKG